ncbi:M14-type cytosolic carboxypeptidase [Gallaecimonas sp. GXIMD4217]|uniref:M14 family metallopeptidase n=1 Tax=Gallaecimonas sp. GXIMD4217 TaxID=3131927 RepID=UPI00311AC9B6
MHISAGFDSGNIQVLRAERPDDIELHIRKDNASDFYQWFHFRVHAEAQQELVMRITNAGGAAYSPKGWEGYQAVASYDRHTWFRVPTSFDGQTLTIEHTQEEAICYYAYFAPYSWERHQDLLAAAQDGVLCKASHLGETLDGREMTLLTVGDEASAKRKIWIIARQHPGETMAEWFMEGLLDRLLDDEDGVARALLKDNVFYIVPNMNPDGSVRGHLRTNALGMNLNREWAEPTMDKSPEVFLVRQAMLDKGCDLFLDIHGDEGLPYNFVAGCEGIPSFDERHKGLQDSFKAALLAVTPEFQTVYGYDIDEPGKADLRIAANWVGEQFKCLSYTIEMPFKDNADLPDEAYGWSPARCGQLGQDVLAALWKHLG